MGARTARTQKVIVLDNSDDKDEGESPTAGLPLFPDKGPISGVQVYRIEPIEEGNLGTLGPDSDEETIRRRFGGGLYKISAKGPDGKYVGSTQITIGGDPKFESADARRRYRNKMSGLADDPLPLPPAAAPGVSMGELIALLNQGHTQQLEMMRLSMEAQRAESNMTNERRAKEMEEARQRDREFNATLLQIMKKEPTAGNGLELVNTLLKGLTIGKAMASSANSDSAGDSDDPLITLVRSLPSILEHGGRLVEQHQQGKAAPAAGPEAVTLTGPIADQLKAAVQSLVGRGYSPAEAQQLAEHALLKGVGVLATVPNRTTAPAAAAAAPEAPPAPAGPAHPPRRTSRPASRQRPAPRATAGR